MRIQTILSSFALLQGVLAAPKLQSRQGRTCSIIATEKMTITNNPGNGSTQPPTIWIYPSLSVHRDGEVIWSNTEDMPNSQTISDIGLANDLEWTLDYGTPGFDKCRISFGNAEYESPGSWESSGVSPRTENSKCEITFEC